MTSSNFKTANSRGDNLVKTAVQSIAIILNTAKVYEAGHPVLQRIISERFREIKEAVNMSSPLKLVFRDGQVLWQDKLVAAGQQFAENLARSFEKKGVTGLEIERDVKQKEFEFFALIMQEIERGSDKRLNELLKDKEVTSISEYTPEDKRGDGIVSTGRASEGRSDIYDLDLDSQVDLDNLNWDEIIGSPAEGSGEGFYRFTSGVLGDVLDDQSILHQKSRIIADEFERRLETEIENYKQHTEEHIQRLESIKELVLKELEERGIAALVIDSDLTVLAMNNSARQLLGNISQLEESSPVAGFVRSGKDADKLDLDGSSYTAHLVIEEGEKSTSQTVLICLD